MQTTTENQEKKYLTTFKIKDCFLFNFMLNSETISEIKQTIPDFFLLSPADRMHVVREMQCLRGYTIQTNSVIQSTKHIEVTTNLNERSKTHLIDELAYATNTDSVEIDKLLNAAIEGDSDAAIKFCKLFKADKLQSSVYNLSA